MYIVFDLEEGDKIFCDTEEEAQAICEDWIKEYLDNSKCWGADLHNMIGYAEVKKLSREKIYADRKDYTDEEWEEEGYSLDASKIIDYELEAPENKE